MRTHLKTHFRLYIIVKKEQPRSTPYLHYISVTKENHTERQVCK